MVEIGIELFGKPEWELGDLEDVEPEEVRRLGDLHRKRLYRAAEIMEKLRKKGYKQGGTLYDILFYKDVTRAEVEKELKELGIEESEVFLLEMEEEEE